MIDVDSLPRKNMDWVHAEVQPFKVGDIVISLSSSGTCPSSYVRGEKYEITGIEKRDSNFGWLVNTRSVESGRTNGWWSVWFIADTDTCSKCNNTGSMGFISTLKCNACNN